MSGTGEITPVELETLATMAAAGQGQSQYRINNASDRERALRDGWPRTKQDPFHRLDRGLPIDGVLDTLAGYVQASKACTFALRKLKSLGATIILDGAAGKVDEILYGDGAGGDRNGRRAMGIRTSDGREHLADVVIVAAGPRTHELVPELAVSMTATAANIIHVKVPAHLHERFRADVFPVFSWGYTGSDEDCGLSGFPIDGMLICFSYWFFFFSSFLFLTSLRTLSKKQAHLSSRGHLEIPLSLS